MRCGASEVFRAGGCDSITDDDIDSILDKGVIDCNHGAAQFALMPAHLTSHRHDLREKSHESHATGLEFSGCTDAGFSP